MPRLQYLNLIFRLLLRVRQDHVAQTACMSACQHMARTLMDLLLSEDIKQVSMGALQQVNLDIIQCERESQLSFNFSYHSSACFINDFIAK